MTLLSRREALAGLGACVASGDLHAEPRIVMNDASRLNPTAVMRHWHVEQREADFIAGLRAQLKRAAAERLPVAVGAARHSMGGQSLIRNGVAMTFDIEDVEMDRAAKSYRCHAGTRWHQVVAHLDAAGFSPAVMQSNADFGVGATFCVNAHGWPTPYGPFGSTVRAIRLMLADGAVVNCSRDENAELFQLAMGGYGLFGVILDLEVEMVENVLLRPTFETTASKAFASRFTALANAPDVPMIYGRLNVARDDFFNEALIVSWRPEPTPPQGLPAVERRGRLTEVTRRIYRAQPEHEWAKRFRWVMESRAMPTISGGVGTRNALMDEPVVNLENRDHDRTDILHEYFIAPERFNEFVDGCRQIIPKASSEFLNVTLRHVKQDEASVLSFATTERIAAVMSFSQKMDEEGESDMIRTTEALIELVGSLGGSFYLPYRLHARPDQLRRVYPGVTRFVERKRHYDPGLLFQNTMWNAYFANI